MERKKGYRNGSRLIANFNRVAQAAIAVVGVALLTQQSAQALTWAEIGDADSLPGTAQDRKSVV